MQVPQLSFWKRYHVLGISVTLLLVLLTVISAQLTGVDVGAFAKNSPQFLVILKQMQQPDWNYLSQIQKPLAQTIQMAVLGTRWGRFWQYHSPSWPPETSLKIGGEGAWLD